VDGVFQSPSLRGEKEGGEEVNRTEQEVTQPPVRGMARWVRLTLFALLPLGAGFLMIAFHPRRRGLHDLLAGTYVIQVSPGGGRGEGWRYI